MQDSGCIRHHLSGLLDLWAGQRDETGGFHCSIRGDGSRREVWLKPVLIQARLLYNFSEGIRLGLAGSAAQAEHAWRYLREQAVGPHGWYHSFYKGERVGGDVLDVYSNSFVALAMARYGQVTGERTPIEEAHRLLAEIRRQCCPAPIAEAGVLGQHHRAGEAVDWRHGALMPRYSGNALLHFTEAVVRLHDADPGPELVALVQDLRTFFLARILDPELYIVYDHFHGDWTRPHRGRCSELGHALEWVDFFRCVPGCALPPAVERGILERAAGAVLPNGLFQSGFYQPECRSAGPVDFWVQVEAVKGFNLGYALLGAPYDELCRRCLTAYFRCFVDEDGAVFETCDPNEVVLDRDKGGYWKCDYHSVRMCVDLIERSDGIYQAAAVA
ncbi:MAG: AGE family epimerase/isomerase [Planctomycetota bacterium]